MAKLPAPEGRKNRAGFLRPSGAADVSFLNPRLAPWATVFRPCRGWQGICGMSKLSFVEPLEPLEPRTLFAVPAGLTETRVVTNLEQPVAMAFAPDGRLFVTEKT